jgi:hypothetical protein
LVEIPRQVVVSFNSRLRARSIALSSHISRPIEDSYPFRLLACPCIDLEFPLASIMPTYLLHGFRWQRAAIRIHIILQDLDDAAAEWIIAPASATSIINSFYSMFDFLPPSNPPPPPVAENAVIDDHARLQSGVLSKKNTKSMSSLRSMGRKKKGKQGQEVEGLSGAERTKNTSFSGSRSLSTGGTLSQQPSDAAKPVGFNDWSMVKLVEQYDPDDLESVSQPYAYVADYIVDVSLSASIAEEMVKYEVKSRESQVSFSPGSGTPAMADVGNGGDTSGRNDITGSNRLGWFERLRDGLQKGEDIGWYVVVCGDEERRPPSMEWERGSQSGSEGSELDRTAKGSGLRGFFKGKNIIVEE